MTPRFPLWLVLGVPAAAALALYWPVMGTGFLGDDFGLIHAFDGCDGVWGTAQCVGQMFVSGVGPPSNQYRPLTMATFAVNAAIGVEPFGWHLVNVLLHAANAALVALFAWQLQDGDTTRARAAALMAGWLFAWLPFAVEPAAWVAARFDGLALLGLLVAACAFMRSATWRDGYGLLSLAATVLSYMSKESAAIGVPLILALAWHRQRLDIGLLRGVARALRAALPWLVIAAAYFTFRRIIFGDPFRFFPGASPFMALITFEWLASVPGMLHWGTLALPGTGPRTVFVASGLALTVCALAAGVAERAKGRALAAMAFALLAAFALLLSQWQWSVTGEGGRVLAAIGAIALVAAALPLAARGPPRALAWMAALVLLGSQFVLTQAAVARWVRAGEDTPMLARKLAALARAMPLDSYAFVVIPDHIGAIPFGRNAQIGFMLPPIQSSPITQQLIVQTDENLAPWPDLFTRDVVGRLKREQFDPRPSSSVPPKVAPPHATPDHWLCWSPNTRALQPLDLVLAPDLANWDAAWKQALDVSGCRG
ncbi:MAG: hypothetical protein ABI569_02400 [Casimicrobiaceae bacterium]